MFNLTMTESTQPLKDKSGIEKIVTTDKPTVGEDGEFRPSPELARRLERLRVWEELSKSSNYVFGPGLRPREYIVTTDKPTVGEDGEFRPSPDLARRLERLRVWEEASETSDYVFGPGLKPREYKHRERYS